MGVRTMIRADRLNTSMGYIAAIFHKANEFPRVEPPSSGCVVRGATIYSPEAAFRALARCQPSRLRAAALASPSHGPHRTAFFIPLRTPPPGISRGSLAIVQMQHPLQHSIRAIR